MNQIAQTDEHALYEHHKNSEVPIVKLTPPPIFKKEDIQAITIGLRPFRNGGIRLDREDIKDKVFYHNYGHGGGGASLAPGCSRMIVERFVQDFGEKVQKVAILGSGYMGLFQSIFLAELGFEVNLYADNFPMLKGKYDGRACITSQVAGGLWMPFGLEYVNRALHNTWAKESWEFYKKAYETNRLEGLSWHDVYMLNYENPIPMYVPKGMIPVKKVRVDFGNGVLHDAEVYRSLLMDGDFLLNGLMREAKEKGVRFHNKKFETLDEILKLEEKVIFNCTGWGSAKLFGDDKILPIAGHLLYLKKVSGLNYFLCAKNKKGEIVSTYPHAEKLAIGLSYQKLGYIQAPVEETVQMVMNNMNEWVRENTMPKPKL